MVGYQGNSSNYRVYNPITKKVTVSRDVIFNERAANDTSSSKRYDNEFALSFNENLNADEPIFNDDEDDENVRDDNMERPQNNENIDGARDEQNAGQEQQGAAPHAYRLRERSNIRAPIRYQANLVDYPVLSYEEAVNGPESSEWKRAIKVELDSHRENSTWKFVPQTPGMKRIDSKCVFRVLQDERGNPVKYKARLCARGFRQVEGLDYKETFAPAIGYDSLRIFLALVTHLDLELVQFDIKTAFLYGDLQEEIFMEVPEGIRSAKSENNVCRLLKAWYGLKQAARCWNEKFTRALRDLGLEQCASEKCIFRGCVNEDEVIVALFVDDGLVAAKSHVPLRIVIDALSESFEIELGDSACFVGMEFVRDRRNKRMFLHQSSYASKVLSKFKMESANPVCVPADLNQVLCAPENKSVIEKVPYREAVGSLMFLAVVSCRDIAYAVNSVSKFSEKHDASHWNVVKRIVKYVAGSIDFGIVYEAANENFDLTGYTDSDYTGDIDTRRSTSGFVFFLCDGAVTWCCQRQKTVTLSTTEAEYVAAALAAREAVWLRQVLKDLAREQNDATCLFIDNQSAIRMLKNPEFHKRTKHIDVKFHFVRDLVENNTLVTKFVSSDEQRADVFTKAFPRSRFSFLRECLGMRSRREYLDECEH